MVKCPVPVVMLSSTTQSGTDSTLTAMEYGAVDFVAKTSGTISLDLHKIQDELIRKVEAAVNIPVAKLNKPFGTKLPPMENKLHTSRSGMGSQKERKRVCQYLYTA